MALYVTKVGGAEGKSVTLVGTYSNSGNTASLNLKNDLPDYQKYTAADFLIAPVTIDGHHNANVGGNWTKSFSPSIGSYSNGVLTVNNAGVSGGVTEGSYYVRASRIAVYLK